MGLAVDLGRLAFEFDCVARGVDYAKRAWPLVLGGGLAGLANRLTGLAVAQSAKITRSDWEERPLSPEQMLYIAEDAYLSWAVADHFISTSGMPVQPEWILTMCELYGEGSHLFRQGMYLPQFDRDWTEAREQHEAIMRERAKRVNRKKKESRKRSKADAGGAAEHVPPAPPATARAASGAEENREQAAGGAAEHTPPAALVQADVIAQPQSRGGAETPPQPMLAINDMAPAGPVPPSGPPDPPADLQQEDEESDDYDWKPSWFEAHLLPDTPKLTDKDHGITEGDSQTVYFHEGELMRRTLKSGRWVYDYCKE